VKISDDFRAPKNGSISKSEAMLIYVAVTRAKLQLDHSALHWLQEAIAQAQEEAAEAEAGSTDELEGGE
jgi:hypothetical protein